jgi:hypothetical protein
LKKIEITRIKPNPVGKDKVNGTPLPKQLLGEWVEIQNVGDEVVSGVFLFHTTFDDDCSKQKEENFAVITNIQIGESVRVHTGNRFDEPLMADEDRRGASRHQFANRTNYILNNKCGDTITASIVEVIGSSVSVSYEPNPVEGAVLEVGNGLTVVENK